MIYLLMLFHVFHTFCLFFNSFNLPLYLLCTENVVFFQTQARSGEPLNSFFILLNYDTTHGEKPKRLENRGNILSRTTIHMIIVNINLLKANISRVLPRKQ